MMQGPPLGGTNTLPMGTGKFPMGTGTFGTSALPMGTGMMGPKLDMPNYGATEPLADDGLTLGRENFRRGVAMGHSLLLLSIFVPPALILFQLTSITDVKFFVGMSWAKVALVVFLLTLVLPLLHFRMRLHPWAFLLSIWIPAFTFVAVAWHYRDVTFNVGEALASRDCNGFAEKRPLESAYDKAYAMHLDCGNDATYSITECPHYQEMFAQAPYDFTYLQDLEYRFQCAGFCHSGRRLWDNAGSSAPACSLFAEQWIYGAHIQAEFVLWYNVIVLLLSVPAMLAFDSFFKDYYIPMAK